MTDNGKQHDLLMHVWGGLRNKSSRNHRRVMKKLNKAAK